jgi:hypothetical protein
MKLFKMRGNNRRSGQRRQRRAFVSRLCDSIKQGYANPMAKGGQVSNWALCDWRLTIFRLAA